MWRQRDMLAAKREVVMRGRMMLRTGFAAAVAGLVTVAAGGQALADCFENIGCPNDHYIPKSQLRQLGCDPLWTVRNSIFRDNGYCFKTARAKELFSNEGCSYTDQAAVPLNAYERENVARIVSVEREMGCR
jgi:hypothetical protein